MAVSRNVIVCALLNILSGFLSGYVLVGFATAAGTIWRCTYGLAEDTPDNQWMIGALFGVINLTGLPYGFFAGPVMNKLGRQSTCLRGALLVLLGTLMSAVSVAFTHQAVARLITGLGSGMISSVIPVYITETSPVKWRGTLQAMGQVSYTFMILVGSMVSYSVLGPNRDLLPRDYCPPLTSVNIATLNVLMWLPGIIVAFLLVLVSWRLMRESKTWMRRTGSFNIEASRSGGSLPRISAEILETYWVSERTSLLIVVNDEDDEDDELTDSLPSGIAGLCRVPRALLIAIAMAFALQGTGINAVMFYAPRFLAEAGIERERLGTVVIMVVNFVTTLMAMSMVAKVGRRALLMPSLVVMTVTLLAIPQVYLHIRQGTLDKSWCFVLLFGYIAGFEFGPGTLFGVILNEIFPEPVLPYGSSLVGTGSGVLALLTTSVFPPLAMALGDNVFYIFGGVSLIVLVFLFACLPETKGLSKKQIAAKVIQPDSWSAIGESASSTQV